MNSKKNEQQCPELGLLEAAAVPILWWGFTEGSTFPKCFEKEESDTNILIFLTLVCLPTDQILSTSPHCISPGRNVYCRSQVKSELNYVIIWKKQPQNKPRDTEVETFLFQKFKTFSPREEILSFATASGKQKWSNTNCSPVSCLLCPFYEIWLSRFQVTFA